MSDRVFNVLFLCTGNSARSVLAESILQKDGAGKFRAFSAGSQPKGEVNPWSLRVLKSLGYPHEGFRSKSWDEFSGPHAPAMDFIFTVCASAAGETCPIWPGAPVQVHWGYPDPSNAAPEQREQAFELTRQALGYRMLQLLALPWDTLDAAQRRAALNEIAAR